MIISIEFPFYPSISHWQQFNLVNAKIPLIFHSLKINWHPRNVWLFWIAEFSVESKKRCFREKFIAAAAEGWSCKLFSYWKHNIVGFFHSAFGQWLNRYIDNVHNIPWHIIFYLILCRIHTWIADIADWKLNWAFIDSGLPWQREPNPSESVWKINKMIFSDCMKNAFKMEKIVCRFFNVYEIDCADADY